jgi:iron complex transport system substrate-binding protein
VRRALVLALLAAACSRQPATSPAAAAAPTRIVALTCASVDVIDVLGELDRVVAVEEDCPAPGTRGKVKIRNEDHPGKLAAINVESILELHPDAVIAKPDLRPALEGRGLRVLWAPPNVRLANLPQFVGDVGALLGVADRARAVVDAMHAKEAAIRRRTASLPRVRVYFETTGLGWTQGSRAVMHDMIQLAGGTNIAGDLDKFNVTLTPEAVLAADPEVVVLGPFTDPPDVVAKRAGWSALAAVRAGRVHQIPIDRRHVTLGTPRCLDGCEEFLVPWLHPELAAKER